MTKMAAEHGLSPFVEFKQEKILDPFCYLILGKKGRVLLTKATNMASIRAFIKHHNIMLGA